MKTIAILISMILISTPALADSLHPATGSKCYAKAVDMVYAAAVVEPVLRGAGSRYLSYSESTTTVGEGDLVVQEDHLFSVNEISIFQVSFVQENCLLVEARLEVGE